MSVNITVCMCLWIVWRAEYAAEKARVTALEELGVQDNIVELPLNMSTLLMSAFCAPDEDFYEAIAIELNLGKAQLVIEPLSCELGKGNDVVKHRDLNADRVKYLVRVEVYNRLGDKFGSHVHRIR